MPKVTVSPHVAAGAQGQGECSSFQTPAGGFLGLFYCFSGLYFIYFHSVLFYFLVSINFSLVFGLVWGAGEGVVVIFCWFLVAIDPCGKKLA